GALSVSFIPIFTTYLTKEKNDEAWDLASSVLNASLIVYAVLGLIIFLFPTQINAIIAPGLEEAAVPLAANLTRLIVLSELFLIIGIFLTSVLQSYHRFVAPAIAPVIYNLGVIFGIVVLSRFYGIYGVGVGVLIGSLLHILVQLFIIGSFGFKYRFNLNLSHPGVTQVLKLSLPRAIAVGVGQLEWMVSIFLASLLSVGSVSILKYAGDLQNLPIGLFGVSIATAALPTLAREWAVDKGEEFKATFVSSLNNILYLTVPFGVILAVLRIPITRLVLGSGVFDWPSTVATANTMSFFAIGIFAESCFLLVARAFYAMHDTVTPLRVALVALALHTLLSIFFVVFLAQGATTPVAYLALASSFSGIFSFLTLLFILNRRVGGFVRKQLLLPVTKILVASFAMGLFLYLPLHLKFENKFLIDYIIDTRRVLNLLFLTGVVASFGVAVYLALTWWFRSEELRGFVRLLPDLKAFGKELIFEENIENLERVKKQ
ncbi:MAG: murein biosynthesis integral membrane protein MurJ, partial [bacterium]|nr:murein biosynthesis integral membrane protein MurJ [bacterium]